MSNSILEELRNKGVKVSQLAKQFKVTRSTVYQAMDGYGSRAVRIEIAIIINKKPSELWTENRKQSRTDDALCLMEIINRWTAS